MTTATAPATSSWRGNPVEFMFAVLGFIAILACLPVAILAGGSIGGWVLGAVLFVLYWGGGLLIGKATLGLSPTHAVGVAGLTFIARVWLVFGVLLVVAIRSRDVGVTAMLVFAVAFTFDMMGRMILHALRQKAREHGVEL